MGVEGICRLIWWILTGWFFWLYAVPVVLAGLMYGAWEWKKEVPVELRTYLLQPKEILNLLVIVLGLSSFYTFLKGRAHKWVAVFGVLISSFVIGGVLTFLTKELASFGVSQGVRQTLLYFWMGLFFVAAPLWAYLAYKWRRAEPPLQDEYHRRGRGLISFDQAVDRAKALNSLRRIFFGMLSLPDRLSPTHFAVVGATGSGKTITLRLLMQSVIANLGGDQDARALVYDAKQDVLSTLAGMSKGARVVTLNPFDERCVAWDMACDITAPATAQQVAYIFIPKEHSSQPFFADASRALLTGVLVSFIKTAGTSWTFRDVILALKSQSRLKEVLLRCPETSDLVEQYFSEERLGNDIMSTVATKIQKFEYIAAAWDRAGEKLSLNSWLHESTVLVLGNDEATRSALDAVNQVVFKRLTELILAQRESTSRRTWIFLDEVRHAGKLDGLPQLLTMGRSKGACVVLGFQDIEGLAAVYGEKEAAEIAGLCANKAILRTDSPQTAKWASSLFGEKEVLEVRRNTGQGTTESGGHWDWQKNVSVNDSSGTSENITKREVILPSEILSLPATTPENGLSGFYIIPEIGAYGAKISGEWIAGALVPKDESVPDIIRRPDEHQYLRQWTAADRERLGIENELAENDPQGVQPEEQKTSDEEFEELMRWVRR